MAIDKLKLMEVIMERSLNSTNLVINEDMLRAFNAGEASDAYCYLGAHLYKHEDFSGVRFAVWAPDATAVSVVGDFNGWNGSVNSMEKVGNSGVWQCYIPHIPEESLYKYQIRSKDNQEFLKTDPYGFYDELRPNTASKTYDISNFNWDDGEWLRRRETADIYNKPISIYEVHLGSWKRNQDGGFMSYREFGELIDYVCDMGYTHIELMPITEHPLDDSWGYQVTGYYSVTSRFGTPREFCNFVDQCHKRGIGVILDWVPSHFPKDFHGLGKFDGTPLYEYADSRLGEHKGWGTYVFNYRRYEVVSFLMSSAMFWLDVYHIDGLRVDAVSSMLYLNYGRDEGEWIPNYYGGVENLEAINFVKKLNEKVYQRFPNVMMIAEEATSWPSVTGPTYTGGLGFSHKWNMGWMNDILKYMELDPLFRSGNHNLLTFSMMYAFSENFILPLSHDEVVHGKKSLLSKMPGCYKDKFSNLRTLYGFMMGHPGKKLTFMGGEFGQFIEWRFYSQLDWNLLDYELHYKLKDYVKELNHLYLREKGLWEKDTGWEGFRWINPNDKDRSVISFIRSGVDRENDIVIICNFTPVRRDNYILGVTSQGNYVELLNSDDHRFGGSGITNNSVYSQETAWLDYPYSISVTLPPLSVIYLKCK